MFKNIIFFSLNDFTLTTADLSERLSEKIFSPCARLQMKSIGFTAPAGDDQLVRDINGNLLFQITTEERKLKPKIVALKLAQAVEEFRERHNGEAPGKKALREMTSEIKLNMLPQVFPERDSVDVFIPASREFIMVSTGSHTQAEKLMDFCRELLDAVIGAVLPVQSVESVVTNWITTESVPDDLALEESITLKGFADSSSVVLRNISPFGAEVANHIRENRKVTAFKATLNESTTFNLDTKLSVKGVGFIEELHPELPEEHGEMTPEKLKAYLIDTSLSLQYPEYVNLFNFVKNTFVI